MVTSEIGFVPKILPELTEAQQEEVGEFLHALDEHDDVHRVWAAVKCSGDLRGDRTPIESSGVFVGKSRISGWT